MTESNPENRETADPETAFNLIEQRWLPARRRSGVIEHIAPCQVTEGIAEDPFVGFAWPRPDFNAAAHEFMIGLLSSTAAPADEDVWINNWENPPAPDTLKTGFEQVEDAFNLDGPKTRFLQDIDPLEDAKSNAVGVLLIETPGEKTVKNNTDLFARRGAVSILSRPAVAMALFTLQCYAPSGGSGNRTSVRGGGPMTTLVVAEHARYGDTLWGRLWPNVENKERINARRTDAKRDDDQKKIFPWLGPTRTSNEKEGGSPTGPGDMHPLQVYWGMPRRIRLEFEEGEGRLCDITEAQDSIVVTRYRAKNLGVKLREPKPSASVVPVSASKIEGQNEVAGAPRTGRDQLPALARTHRAKQEQTPRTRASNPGVDQRA